MNLYHLTTSKPPTLDHFQVRWLITKSGSLAKFCRSAPRRVLGQVFVHRTPVLLIVIVEIPNACPLASRTMKYSASSSIDHGAAKRQVSIGLVDLYSSDGARPHQSFISAASMRSPFDPSMNSTFKRQSGFR